VTDPRPAEPPRSELDETELRVLAFERDWADRVGNREAAIREEFGVVPSPVLSDVVRAHRVSARGAARPAPRPQASAAA